MLTSTASTIRSCFTMFLLATMLACDGPTKVLNEASAKGMLIRQLQVKGDAYKLPLVNVTRLLTLKTREDYRSGSYRETDPKLSVQRLLNAGFISQSREEVTFKNVTGKYKAEPPGCGSGGFAIRNRVYTFSLSMPQREPTVSGEYTFDAWYSGGQKADTFRGPVKGEVSPDGNLTLIYGPMFTRTNYSINSQGTTITLTGPALFVCPAAQMTASGSGPGGFVTVPTFTYIFSDAMKALLDTSGNLNAGRMKIDDVHDLLLETDTTATAQFTWHVDLNAAGKAVTGQPAVSGNSRATFRKQPDGTWVLPEA